MPAFKTYPFIMVKKTLLVKKYDELYNLIIYCQVAFTAYREKDFDR